jgi:hypothetical protein
MNRIQGERMHESNLLATIAIAVATHIKYVEYKRKS